MGQYHNNKLEKKTQSEYPILHLVVQDFCFWAGAAGPVHKKNGSRLWATFEGVFSTFSGSIFFSNFFVNTIVSALKRCLIVFVVFFISFEVFLEWNCSFLGLRTFSNVNVLHKSLLLQDWVFRLGWTWTFILRFHLVFVLIFTQLSVNKYLPYVFNSLCKGVSDLERWMDWFFLFCEEVVKVWIFVFPAKQFGNLKSFERLLVFSQQLVI